MIDRLNLSGSGSGSEGEWSGISGELNWPENIETVLNRKHVATIQLYMCARIRGLINDPYAFIWSMINNEFQARALIDFISTLEAFNNMILDDNIEVSRGIYSIRDKFVALLFDISNASNDMILKSLHELIMKIRKWQFKNTRTARVLN